MKLGTLGLAALLLLAACDQYDRRIYFNGNYYPGKAYALDNNPDKFIATVRRVHQGLVGARAAAAYQGMRYCLVNFGNSELTWMAGPERQLTAEETADGRLSVTGICAGFF